MIPIICITLPEHPWGKAVAKNHFHEVEADFYFLDGFDGNLLGVFPKWYHEYNQFGNAHYMGGPQVGCVLSHLSALAMALSMGWEDFVIVEDDIVFNADWMDSVSKAISERPADCGLVQLEHCIDVEKCPPHIPATKVSDSLWKIGYPFSSAAILWRKQAAKMAFQLLRPVSSPFDIMLMQKVYPFAGHLAVVPSPFKQRTGTAEWPTTIYA